MNKALEQSLLKSSLEQISWASHLLAEFEGRKSRTWKLLNKSCDDKIHVQYSCNLSYGIPASWRTFLYLWLGSSVQLDFSLVRCAHSWDIKLNARGETQYLRAPCDIPNILFSTHVKQSDQHILYFYLVVCLVILFYLQSSEVFYRFARASSTETKGVWYMV